MIDKIKYIINLYDLTTSCRDRNLIYKRAYIYSELRKLGYKLIDIGVMLDKNHATVLNGIKVDKQFQNSDRIYDDAIAHIKEYLYPPIGLPKYSIFEDVINCNNTTDLRIIKERITNNQYLERDN
jgi:hypothetical protein